MRPDALRLLFVTALAEVGEQLCRHFGAQGFEVAFTTDGDEALALVKGGSFDVVITCVQVASDTRIELRRCMREQDPEASIILVTDCESVTPAAEALTEGGYDLVATSFDAVELGHVVQQACDKIQLRRENARLHERLAADRMASVVAHEISDPLSSVVTYAKLLVRRLQSMELNDDCRQNLRYLESIAAEAGRCREVVANLLAFSRQPPPAREQVSLNHAVERALVKMQMRLRVAVVKTRLDLARDLPRAYLDPNQIHEALSAVLNNACEAVTEGGEICVSTRREDDVLLVEVADDGAGMTTEVLERAFDSFFTTKESVGAIGLGLAVVYGIIDRHDGRINVHTAPGQGCRVTLVLPIGEAPQAEETTR